MNVLWRCVCVFRRASLVSYYYVHTKCAIDNMDGRAHFGTYLRHPTHMYMVCGTRLNQLKVRRFAIELKCPHNTKFTNTCARLLLYRSVNHTTLFRCNTIEPGIKTKSGWFCRAIPPTHTHTPQRAAFIRSILCWHYMGILSLLVFCFMLCFVILPGHRTGTVLHTVLNTDSHNSNTKNGTLQTYGWYVCVCVHLHNMCGVA